MSSLTTETTKGSCDLSLFPTLPLQKKKVILGSIYINYKPRNSSKDTNQILSWAILSPEAFPEQWASPLSLCTLTEGTGPRQGESGDTSS